MGAVIEVPEFAARACQKIIFGPRVTNWQCFRRGVAKEREIVGGKPRGVAKWWCKQHLPSNEQARHAARDAKYQAEQAADERHWARQEAEQGLMQWALDYQDPLPEGAQKFVDAYAQNHDKMPEEESCTEPFGPDFRIG